MQRHFRAHANSQRGCLEDYFDDIASKLCRINRMKTTLLEWRGNLRPISFTVAEKSFAALFCMAPHSQAVQHLGKAFLVRFVQIIVICFGIVHWALQQAAQHCVHGRRRLFPTPSNDCDDVGATPTNLAFLHCQ
jgi:hypothetical protein